MTRICRRPALLAFVVVNLLATVVAFAEPAPPPNKLVRVGILPIVGPSDNAAFAQAMLGETLGTYGLQVRALEAADEPWEALAANPELDFVIRCIVEQKTAVAFVYDRQTETVRRLAGNGDEPIPDLAAKVLRHVSSHAALESVVVRRKEEAAARLAENPHDYQSLVLMGLALYHEGEWAEAARRFQEAQAVVSNDADVHYYLAMCYQRLDEPEKMAAQLEEVLRIEPLHEAASILLANSHLSAGRTNEAIAIYCRWLDSPQNTSLAHWNLAVAYQLTSDVAQAITHLRQIERGDPQYIRAQQLILELEATEAAARAQSSTAPVVRASRDSGASTENRQTTMLVIGGGLTALLAGGAIAGLLLRRRRNKKPKDAAHRDTVPFPGTAEFLTPVHVHAPGELGNYRLVGKLGQGGMGTVYRAVHRHLNKEVAVKVLAPHLMCDPGAIARFRSEMLAIGRIEHPGIVRARDAGEAGGVHYLVMDYVDGVDLAQLIDQVGPLPVADACELIQQAAVALQHVHDLGLMHRDIKPSNLMLGHDGVVKILDLGLVHLLDEVRGALTVTASGNVVGTVDYMAPEQASGGGQVDARADIYSLGCTLYALLAGHPPFGDSQHATPVSKALAHVNEPPPSIRTVRPVLSDAVVDVLERMLAKLPGDRYGGAAEVAEALGRFTRQSDLKRLAHVDTAMTIAV